MDLESAEISFKFKIAVLVLNRRITDGDYMLMHGRIKRELKEWADTCGGKIILPNRKVAVAKFVAKR